MKKDYKSIFEKLKQKSIGKDKRVRNKRTKIKATLKKSVAVLVSVMSAATIVGCNLSNKKSNNSSKNETKIVQTVDKEWNGYTYYEITNYECNRLDETLSINGLTDYELNGGNRVYNYTANDYSKVHELNESYVRSFYLMTDSNTVDQFCISQGYQNFSDYMMKNGYTNSDGSNNISDWYENDLEVMSKIMESREVGKTK